MNVLRLKMINTKKTPFLMVYTTHKNGDALGMVYGIVLTTLEMIKQYQVCKFNMFLNSPPVS